MFGYTLIKEKELDQFHLRISNLMLDNLQLRAANIKLKEKLPKRDQKTGRFVKND